MTQLMADANHRFETDATALRHELVERSHALQRVDTELRASYRECAEWRDMYQKSESARTSPSVPQYFRMDANDQEGAGGGLPPTHPPDGSEAGVEPPFRQNYLHGSRGSASGGVKEAETIRVAPLPNAGGFRAWRLALITEVTAASGRGDQAFAWLHFVEHPNISIHELRHSNGFESLDSKILAGLVRAAVNTTVGGQISREQEKAARNGKIPKGTSSPVPCV